MEWLAQVRDRTRAAYRSAMDTLHRQSPDTSGADQPPCTLPLAPAAESTPPNMSRTGAAADSADALINVVLGADELCRIFDCLTPYDLLSRAALVCRRW